MKSGPFRVLGTIVAFAILSALYGKKLFRAEHSERNRSTVVETESGAVFGKIETLPNGNQCTGIILVSRMLNCHLEN